MQDFIPDAVLADPRSEAEIAKDYTHERLYGGLPVTWTEKPEAMWKKASNRDQAYSYSCVKQSTATAIEVFTKKVMSAGTYRMRSNAPSGGMFLQNCGDLDKNVGITLEEISPSQKMSDPEMDMIPIPPVLDYKISGYRTFDLVDIDKAAEAIQAYGNCTMTFASNNQEWQRTPKYLGGKTTFNHAIVGIDFTLINGVKCLICQDSAGKGSSPDGVRIITEEYLEKRGLDAMYYLGLKKVVAPIDREVPKADWDMFMRFIAAWKTLFGGIIKGLTK